MEDRLLGRVFPFDDVTFRPRIAGCVRFTSTADNGSTMAKFFANCALEKERKYFCFLHFLEIMCIQRCCRY